MDMGADPSSLLRLPFLQPPKEEEGGSHQILDPSGPDCHRLLGGSQGTRMRRDIEFLLHRLNFNKSRLLTRAAKGFLGKPLVKTAESTSGSQSFDYVPLVSAPDLHRPCYWAARPSWGPAPLFPKERETSL